MNETGGRGKKKKTVCRHGMIEDQGGTAHDPGPEAPMAEFGDLGRERSARTTMKTVDAASVTIERTAAMAGVAAAIIVIADTGTLGTIFRKTTGTTTRETAGTTNEIATDDTTAMIRRRETTGMTSTTETTDMTATTDMKTDERGDRDRIVAMADSEMHRVVVVSVLDRACIEAANELMARVRVQL